MFFAGGRGLELQKVDVLKAKFDKRKKQAGAELCQAQLKLQLVKLILVWQQKIDKFS